MSKALILVFIDKEMLDIKNTIKSIKGPILVTGASGFLGANLLKLILIYRNDVIGISRYPRNWRISEIEESNFSILDLNNFQDVKFFVESYKPNTIFHLASYGSYSFENNKDLIIQTNFNSSVNLVNLLNKKGISAFINAGSSSEYGLNCSGPSEESKCLPDSTYAISKLAFSEYLQYLGRIDKFPCLNLRLYSVYGNFEDPSRLIPSILKAGTQGKWIDLVDSKISRDFVHVDDVCKAFIKSASIIKNFDYGDSINIGTGRCTTIKELTKICNEIFDYKTQPVFGNMSNRNWDRSDWFANISKANKVLGWSPQINLEEGLKQTINWIKTIDNDHFKSLSKKAKNNKKIISAVIASYKDEMAIPILYSELKEVFTKLKVEYEIIFVNDGSPDNSESVILELSKNDNRVKGISHSRNFGSQMAFKSGMEISKGDCVVLLDGDLQDPPYLINNMYHKWLEGNDVVYGIRNKRDMNLIIELTYKIFYRVFSSLSYLKIPHDAGDFSLLDKRVVNKILECNERDLFIRGIRAYVGFKQTGVKYKRPERRFGKSTNNFWKNIEWAKKGIFSYSNIPLTALTFIGIFGLIISILLSLLSILIRIFFPLLVPQGLTTLILLILMLGSLNLFAISIVGEYVLKITQEVKKRPHFIRRLIIENGFKKDI